MSRWVYTHNKRTEAERDALVPRGQFRGMTYRDALVEAKRRIEATLAATGGVALVAPCIGAEDINIPLTQTSQDIKATPTPDDEEHTLPTQRVR